MNEFIDKISNKYESYQVESKDSNETKSKEKASELSNENVIFTFIYQNIILFYLENE